MTKPKADEDKRFVKKQVTEMIDVELTQEERDDRAKLASKLHGDLQSQELELKEDNEYAKGKIKKTKAAIATAAHSHNTGKEMQKVSATQVFDVETCRTWFEYRGKRYAERRMYDPEIAACQKDIFGERPIKDVTGAFDIDYRVLADAGRFITLKVWKKWTEAEKVEALTWASKFLAVRDKAAATDGVLKIPKVPIHVEALPTEMPAPKTSEELLKEATEAGDKLPDHLAAGGKKAKPKLVEPAEDPRADIGYGKPEAQA